MTTEARDTTTMGRVAAELRQRSLWYKIGWGFLVLTAGITAVGHFVAPLAFAPANETIMFWALTAMSIYAMAVLVIPYRRGEPWAWWVTWIHVAIFAVVIFSAPNVGPIYLGLAVGMAGAQLATRSAFQNS